MRIFLLTTLIFVTLSLSAEEWLTGSVSFLSTQNVYVKFENTSGIGVGDTLYVNQKGKLTAAMLVKEFSSISCVCTPLNQLSLPLATPVFARPIHKKGIIADNNEEKAKASVDLNNKAIQSLNADNLMKGNRQKIDGRLSLSSYSDISDYGNNSRFRYNFALNASHINNSRFSGEANIAVSHNSNDSLPFSSNISHYLKIYALSLKYDIDSTSAASFGRKINANIANLGAIDGLQYEKSVGHFAYGAVVGSRPDYYDYGVNPNLLEFGAYASHYYQKGRGRMRSTLGLFNQMNSFNTDRRFGYFQHSNTLLKKVDFFGSVEFDLYKLDKNRQATNTFDLTSTYLSLRYNPWRRLSLSMSYDARKNVYYYETFKNRVDSTIDKETRQGLRFQFNYRPFRFLSWGGSAGLNTPHISKNASTYLSFPDLPWIHASLMINATLLKTQYLDGTIYGASLSRDIIPGKLFGQLEYRLVDYQFNNSPSTLPQNIGEFSLNWQVAKRLMFSADYEFTKESGPNYHRIFLNLTQRF
ncbi:hypothetical protein [Parabacteroides sp. FAFU027]|uniref:hypothetical protein n=1 Tax=Parabacteroides sp. FAFU027 TaxID=2922715 RepID=UPI001FAFD22A|nr:hypothetical protein [Parabacteroides sp. FAFU027]